MRRHAPIIGAAFVAAGLGAASTWWFKPSAVTAPADRAAIERTVRAYILANPEIIPEAINRLQTKEVEKLLATNREAIERPFAGAYAGPADATATLVVFNDFACPYCRQAAGDVSAILRSDPKLKVVWRDFPVLGQDSQTAALAALSAARQGRYVAFHDAMFGLPGRPNREKLIRAVRAAGLNERRTAADLGNRALQAELQRNLGLGRALGLTGTPAYVIGDRILNGAVGPDELRAAIAEARRS